MPIMCAGVTSRIGPSTDPAVDSFFPVTIFLVDFTAKIKIHVSRDFAHTFFSPSAGRTRTVVSGNIISALENEFFLCRVFDDSDYGQYAQVNGLKNMDVRLKTLLSIGGYSFGTQPFRRLSSTQPNRKIFIDSALAFVRRYNFDGVDLDWEFPSGAQDKANFVLLLKELKVAMEAEARTSRKPRLLLTAAVAAGYERTDQGYNVAEMSKELDFIFLMSYDFHGSWEPTAANHHAALFARSAESSYWKTLNVDYAARYWVTKGADPQKVIIGLASYGRGWTLPQPANTSAPMGG